MNCLNCDAEMIRAPENVPYRALPGVTLVAIMVSRCPECGEYEVEIPRPNDLDRTLVAEIIRRESRLSRHEVVFLRHFLGWSQPQLSRHLHITPETISRWENGRLTVGESSDLLLRMIAANQVQDAIIERLPDLAKTEPSPSASKWSYQNGWQLAA